MNARPKAGTVISDPYRDRRPVHPTGRPPVTPAVQRQALSKNGHPHERSGSAGYMGHMERAAAAMKPLIRTL